jgi:N-acetylneuraminic acid mutarotase
MLYRAHVISLVLVAACQAPDVTFTKAPGGGDNDDGNVVPQLVAIAPVVANTNQMIALEGSFGAHVTVNFPGGVSQDATVLGAHRAIVSVPVAATQGALSITTAGATVGEIEFRHASFTMALGSFGLADSVRNGTQLATPRQLTASVVIANYVYVLGGENSTALGSIERATINGDGTLRPFATVTDVALMTPRSGHTAVALGNYLYVMGGRNGGALSSVERATINADGTLGAFAVLPDVFLDTPRYEHTSAVIGNYLYVIGGTNGGSLNSVERAVINPDSSLSGFTPVADASLRTARERHTSAVIGNYLYVVGGIHGGSLNSVERAAIAGDGLLGAFVPAPGVALATPRDGHASAVVGNNLYVLGGVSGFLPVSDVERATVNADGSLSSFAKEPAVSMALSPVGDTTVVIGNYLYLMGAFIARASIVGDGLLGAFAPAPGVSMATGRSRFVVFVANNFLYAVGGSGGPTTVERAAINVDGSLERFANVSGVHLSEDRVAPASVVIGNRFYVLSGDGGNRPPTSTIDYAPIDPDGSLENFTPTIPLAGPVPEFTAVVLHNNIYAVSALPNQNFAQQATISPDGSLGTFSGISGITLINQRSGYTTAVIGKYVYFVAGLSLGPTTSVERATTDYNGTLSTFTTASQLVTSRYGQSGVVIGNYLYILGGYHNGGSPESSVERAAIAADGSVGAFAIVPGVNLVTPRFRHANIVIGNFLYVLGGQGAGTGYFNTIERAVIGPDDALGPFAPASEVPHPPGA